MDMNDLLQPQLVIQCDEAGRRHISIAWAGAGRPLFVKITPDLLEELVVSLNDLYSRPILTPEAERS